MGKPLKCTWVFESIEELKGAYLFGLDAAKDCNVIPDEYCLVVGHSWEYWICA